MTPKAKAPARRATPGGDGRTASGTSRRANQRYRTRKDLLEAAQRLLEAGQLPTVAEVAEEARVSRATAYRYFPSQDSLLVEAPLDEIVPTPERIFSGGTQGTVEDRLDRAETALHEMAYAHEAQLRAHIRQTMDQWFAARESGESGEPNDVPLRQNRRTPLIDAALSPVRTRMDDQTYQSLQASLALIFGTESMIVFTDVLGMGPEDARRIKSWAMRTLVRGALGEAASSS